MNPALREVTYEQAKKFADLNRLKFEETSALTNARVTDVFDNLLHYICDVRSLQDNIGNDQMNAEGKKYKKLTEFTHPNDAQ